MRSPFSRDSSTPAARAVRGVALAQLEELEDAERELAAAASEAEATGNRALLARCRLALVDVHLAARRLATAREEADAVRELLTELGDDANLALLQLLTLRLSLLAGRLDEAVELLDGLPAPSGSRVERCLRALTAAELEVRRFQPQAARIRLQEAREHATEAGHALLQEVVRSRLGALDRKVARLVTGGSEREVSAQEVESLTRSARDRVVVDALRRRVRLDETFDLDFRTRFVPFDLLVALVRRHPEPVRGDALIAEVFEETRPDESHHSRLRVSLGRLRELLPDRLGIAARDGAWRLACAPTCQFLLLLPLAGHPPQGLLALLADGEAWSASDLADCQGRGVRATQRDLSALVEEGLVAATGQARARRYRAAGERAGIASQLLLAGLLDPDRDSPQDTSS